jgi:hypothetical protein
MRASPLRALVVLVGAASAAVLWAGPAAAAAPSNDNFAQPIAIGSLPFSDTQDLTEATTEPGEWFPCYYGSQSSWYSYTPSTNQVVRFDDVGSSSPFASVDVYRDTGGGLSGLSYMGCGYAGQSVTVHLQAGNTYFVQAVSGYGYGGSVRINANEVPAPSNDNFANAMPVSNVPFSDTQSASAATTEPREPTPTCAPNAPGNSWWYAFTPAQTQSYEASLGSGTWNTEAIFTGSSLGGLTQVACSSHGGASTAFKGVAGNTYHIQVSDVYGGTYGPITLNLSVAPPPSAAFSVFPSDPSIYDTVNFWGLSSDPAGLGIAEELYDFGDGTSAVGCCPDTIGGAVDATHRYAKDGDYTAKVTATTPDGRTASYVLPVHVRTHDVSLSKLTVPQSAHPGQTRSITVGLISNRYTENVQVELFKSVSGGDFVSVGVLTHDAPAHKTTPFAFNYTFTNDDALVGKVTFKTVATIVGARDAQPGDNTVIALPTKVS